MEQQIRALKGPIIVFGAGGFVGANLVRKLLQYRTDCFAGTHQAFVPWRLLGLPSDRVIQCDLTSAQAVDALFSKYGFQTIFYFAAYGAYSRQSEVARIYETNVLGLIHTVEAAKRRGFSALIHAGSSSEYGINCQAPLEQAPKLPNSHYSVSKVSASYLVKYWGERESLPILNLRLYSVYGPWEEGDRLVPRLVENGLQGRLPKLVNPEISRDFVYVDDVVAASVLAATQGVRNAPGESLNIGSGRKTTLRQIVDETRSLFSIADHADWGSMPNRAWDLQDWYSNPARAREVLGWEATTDLRRGLEQTRDWIRANGASPEMVPLVDVAQPVRLTAIIACYRDGEAIPHMYDRLTQMFRELKVDYEIIFVNDSSPDTSDEVLAGLCARDGHVLAIEHSRNFGSQNAFRSGMEIATGHAIILMDGDLQDPPEMIPRFYEQWLKGFEVVYGRRVQRDTGAILHFCYKAFYRLFRRLAYVPIPVDAGDFSLIDRKVVNELLQFPETDQYLRGLRAWVGFRQTGVDYVRPERPFGRSTNNWRKNFWWARKAIFSFSFVPLETLTYAGMALTGLSFLGLVGQVVSKLLNPSIPHGISTIIILVLFFGGINILAISILGEYLGKVLEETKRRPKFIRRALRTGSTHLTVADDIDRFVAARLRPRSEAT